MNHYEKTIRIDPNNVPDQYFRHQSMTLDFGPFSIFKMFGDPRLLFGDPPQKCLVTPLVNPLVTPDGGHQGSPKKKPCLQRISPMNLRCAREI